MLITYDNKLVTYDGKLATYDIQLPANTIRCKFSAGYTPTMGDSQVLVDADENIWDIYKGVIIWEDLFENNSYLTKVISANTSNVRFMQGMFYGCTSLTTVPLFDTSNVTTMFSMFYGCTSLTTVPLFDTSNVTTMFRMFYGCTSLTTVPLFDTSNVTFMYSMFEGCTNVESGALALYQQASTQANPPSEYTRCFRNCGRDTVTGAAELAQIPDDWK